MQSRYAARSRFYTSTLASILDVHRPGILCGADVGVFIICFPRILLFLRMAKIDVSTSSSNLMDVHNMRSESLRKNTNEDHSIQPRIRPDIGALAFADGAILLLRFDVGLCLL